MDLFMDLHQYQMISAAKSAAGEAKADAHYMKGKVLEIKELERRIDKLALINRALWSFIQKQGDYSEQDLLDEVKRIDLLDGQADGKLSVPAHKCSKCKRMVHARHERCLYCGSEITPNSAFDRIS